MLILFVIAVRSCSGRQAKVLWLCCFGNELGQASDECWVSCLEVILHFMAFSLVSLASCETMIYTQYDTMKCDLNFLCVRCVPCCLRISRRPTRRTLFVAQRQESANKRLAWKSLLLYHVRPGGSTHRTFRWTLETRKWKWAFSLCSFPSDAAARVPLPGYVVSRYSHLDIILDPCWIPIAFVLALRYRSSCRMYVRSHKLSFFLFFFHSSRNRNTLTTSSPDILWQPPNVRWICGDLFVFSFAYFPPLSLRDMRKKVFCRRKQEKQQQKHSGGTEYWIK